MTRAEWAPRLLSERDVLIRRRADHGAPLGLVDRLGYLYCAPCAAKFGKTGTPVRGYPCAVEPCEGCHRALVDVPEVGA